jgi:hypothetical protein
LTTYATESPEFYFSEGLLLKGKSGELPRPPWHFAYPHALDRDRFFAFGLWRE